MDEAYEHIFQTYRAQFPDISQYLCLQEIDERAQAKVLFALSTTMSAEGRWARMYRRRGLESSEFKALVDHKIKKVAGRRVPNEEGKDE